MRVACVHIPQFALQCATRLDPSLRGAPVAMVSGLDPRLDPAGLRAVHHAPTVLACSRAAWALGVRLGMTATAARARSAELRVVSAEPATERDAIRALADALLSVSSVVDPGGRVGAGGAHLAIYAEVPARTRGGSFGERLVELAGEIGFSVRVGIADDRFTAWVAASHVVGSSAATTSSVVATTVAASTVAASTVAARSSLLHAAAPPAQGALHVDEPTVVMVPRGGSAAFLSARPLSLLAIPPEVQHVLEGLGVRTLGEFAALPAPSVARPLEADYQALARGDSGAQLRPYAPDAPIREDIVVSAGNVLELAGSIGGTTAIALIARRIALRLVGRGRVAARLEVSAIRDGGVVGALGPAGPVGRAGQLAGSEPGEPGEPNTAVELETAASSVDDLVRVLGPALERVASDRGPWRLRVVVAAEARRAGAGDEAVPWIGAAGAEVVGITGRAATTATVATARDGQPDRGASRAAVEPALGPLAVVLSTTGSLFALTPEAGEAARRDVHRRTRRGRQRRPRPTPYAQPRLFERISSK